jgi:hypothetical protein
MGCEVGWALGVVVDAGQDTMTSAQLPDRLYHFLPPPFVCTYLPPPLLAAGQASCVATPWRTALVPIECVVCVVCEVRGTRCGICDKHRGEKRRQA